MREQQPFRLPSNGSSGAHNRPEMFAPGDGAKVFRADSREAGNFVFGKRFLSGLDGDHFLPSFMILANV
jgi:hypothetical protein